MRAGPFGIAALSLGVSLLAAATAFAQSPAPTALPAPLPVPGFMPPYEVTRAVRAAGFEPLAPPLREGTTYVLRATDFRGILMRVVVDAHSGAIRAVNRIVAAPGPYGQVGMAASPYEMPPPYVVPPEADAYVEPDEADLAPPPPIPAALHPVPHPASAIPLPRPRPAELAARDAKTEPKPEIKPAAKPAETPAAKTDVKAGAIATPPPASGAPKKPAQSTIPD